MGKRGEIGFVVEERNEDNFHSTNYFLGICEIVPKLSEKFLPLF